MVIEASQKTVSSVIGAPLARSRRPKAPSLPGLAAPRVLEGFDGAGVPRLRPARRPITLCHLLTHTAGFGYNTWNPTLARYMAQTGIPAPGSGQLAALAAPLLFDPGERWEYGINTDWVGRAIEAASGQRLDAYFRQHILDPLGMSETVFVIRPEQRLRLAAMHQRLADGTLAPVAFEMPQAPELFGGGGGLYATAGDYLKLTRMILQRGRLDDAELLRPESVDLMAENQIGALTVGALRSVNPERSNDAEFFPGMVKRWGLGFLITTADAPTGRAAGSLAWAGLANTYYWIDPRRQVTGVLLTQILPFVDPAVMDLYARFERALYDALGMR